MRRRALVVAVTLALLCGWANDAGDIMVPNQTVCQVLDPCSWLGWWYGCSCSEGAGGGGGGAGLE